MASNINILVLIITFTCVVWCHMHEKSDMKHMNMSGGSNGTGGTHGNGGTHGTGGTHGVCMKVKLQRRIQNLLSNI